MNLQYMAVFEGTMTIKLDDGRELSALVFSSEHARQCIERWAANECAENYQSACGDWNPCARPAGHAGKCSHRMERGD